MHTISISRICTWNIALDDKIRSLLELINYDFNSLLDESWEISCSKVGKKRREVLESGKIPRWERYKITDKVTYVRTTIVQILDLEKELKKCKTIDGKIKALNIHINNSNKIIDTFILNIVLQDCSSLQECEQLIEKYWKWLVLNNETIKILLMKCNTFKECEKVLSKYLWKLEITTNILDIIFERLLSNNDEYNEQNLAKIVIQYNNIILTENDKKIICMLNERLNNRICMINWRLNNRKQLLREVIIKLWAVQLYFLL